MKIKAAQKEERPMLYAVLVGLGIAIVLSLVFTGIITALVAKENLPINATTYVLPFVQFLSSFGGCIVVNASVRNNKAISSGIVCAVYYVLLIGCAGLFADGISGKFWLGLITTTIGFVFAIFLNAREKTSVRGRRRRKALR